MFRPAVLAVVPAVLVAGVSGAAGQQAVPTCVVERATIVGTAGNDALTGTGGWARGGPTHSTAVQTLSS